MVFIVIEGVNDNNRYINTPRISLVDNKRI